MDLEAEEASGPVPGALEAEGAPGLDDVLPLLRQADKLHQGNEQSKREGFQLLLNKKLAVRRQLPALPLPLTPGNEGRPVVPTAVTWKGTGSAHPAGLHILFAGD